MSVLNRCYYYGTKINLFLQEDQNEFISLRNMQKRIY